MKRIQKRIERIESEVRPGRHLRTIIKSPDMSGDDARAFLGVESDANDLIIFLDKLEPGEPPRFGSNQPMTGSGSVSGSLGRLS